MPKFYKDKLEGMRPARIEKIIFLSGYCKSISCLKIERNCSITSHLFCMCLRKRSHCLNCQDLNAKQITGLPGNANLRQEWSDP